MKIMKYLGRKNMQLAAGEGGGGKYGWETLGSLIHTSSSTEILTSKKYVFNFNFLILQHVTYMNNEYVKR